ncbi:hypothetical protein FA13DRAFT_307032 [Coprinellus micaceus]|uniref:Uncharacterized protein n=1 Tax=Coprinellus micaceus TaxID=71717 RepID=A0A4Y7SDL9_COPMI|nr:hypothetical protein FA13DRAFT_307032 [Coprinellus micaceus]
MMSSISLTPALAHPHQPSIEQDTNTHNTQPTRSTSRPGGPHSPPRNTPRHPSSSASRGCSTVAAVFSIVAYSHVSYDPRRDRAGAFHSASIL